MHCGAAVSPKPLDEDMSGFLLNGDTWKVDLNEHTREPKGRVHEQETTKSGEDDY